jgi:hypothetical protein
MKTAKVLGLDMPWQLQQLADAIIEQVFLLHCMSLVVARSVDAISS